jgi:hypothetical protein
VIAHGQRDRGHGWRGAGNAHQLGGCGRPQAACRNVCGVPELSRRSKHTLKEVGDVGNRPEIRTPLPLLRPLALPPLPFCSLLCCRRSNFAPSWAAAAPILLPLLLPLVLPPLPFCSLLCCRRSRFCASHACSIAVAMCCPASADVNNTMGMVPATRPRGAAWWARYGVSVIASVQYEKWWDQRQKRSGQLFYGCDDVAGVTYVRGGDIIDDYPPTLTSPQQL